MKTTSGGKPALHVAEPPPGFLGRPPIVVDCSVLSAVLFEEETRIHALQALLGKTLHAPLLLDSEIASVAFKKNRAGSPAAVVTRALDAYVQQEIEFHRTDVRAQYDLALRYGLSTCDAAYLWVAGTLQAPLATFDVKLAKAARVHLAGPAWRLGARQVVRASRGPVGLDLRPIRSWRRTSDSRAMPKLHLLLAALCLAPSLTFAQPLEGRLKKVHDTHTIAVAYRLDALPFSFEDADKKPAGYTIDLCRAVIANIERQLGAGPLQVKWVPVTAQTRFTAIASGQADMECGASTVTLGRKKEVGFSSLIFVDGTGLLVMKTTPGYSLLALAGKKIGVLKGTSNERALAEAMKAMSVSATVVPLQTREEGMAKLESGDIDAVASDRVLLMGMAANAKDPAKTALLAEALSYEPYAIALPRGDWAMQQAVDAGLAQVFSSPALPEIYGKWFAGLGDPSPALQVMYGLGRLPE